jgi:hypothetical protein
MSKTNSNSITSILISELNKKDSSFRRSILSLFRKRISILKNSNAIFNNIRIKNEIKFYNGTHNTLQYSEMKGKEIDIIARNPGEHKPQMMIEVKSSIGETMQDSQRENGEYATTAQKRGIPLIFIIPKSYQHEEELPGSIIKIYWDTIKKKSDNAKNEEFSQQIANFVDLSTQDKTFKFKDINVILAQLKNLLEQGKTRRNTQQNNQWGVGYYYSTDKGDFFIGFSPSDLENYKNYSFTLSIAESCSNTYLGDNRKPPLLYNEGWYYFPILEKELTNEDKECIDESLFGTIKTKLGEEKEKIINICNFLNSKQ